MFGAVWIDASPALYVRKVEDIEQFEHGGAFRITRRISDPPRLEDFAQLELPADDVKDLRSCTVGDCELKLGATSLQALRAEVHWGTPGEKADAEAVFRQRALEYVTAYRKGGNKELAVAPSFRLHGPHSTGQPDTEAHARDEMALGTAPRRCSLSSTR